MQRKNKLLFTVLSMACLLTACGSGDKTSSDNSPSSVWTGDSTSTSAGSNTSGGTTSGSTSTAPVDEEYVIQVNVQAGITVDWSLNKTRAKKGEEIVLTINSVSNGATITGVTMNGTDLVANKNTYTFTMPNRSVVLNIKATVLGEYTLIGDIAAVLTLEDNGIYAARNVKVDSTTDAYFSYQIQTQNGATTILPSTDLDETRCFANVTFSNSKSTGELVVEGGCTYDFFYDPSSAYPCYVVRTEVNYLPNNASSLYSLFEGSMRSESTVNYPDLKEINYSITDIENTNSFNYNYKLYENNVSLATAHDNLNLDGADYYVYKKYDVDKQLLTIVDTYTKAMGNNDATRGEYNNYGAYSANYDVVDDSMYATRTEVNARNAIHAVQHAAHYGYEFEREFMYSYRVMSDSFTSKQINIASTKDATTGNITTTINSYTEDNDDAEVYAAELVFDKAGRVVSLDFTKKQFGKSEWNFNNHAPEAGQTGRTTQKIACTYSYGEPFAGEPKFSTDPYFISSIDTLRFYDSKTNKPADDNNSYLHYNDKVNVTKSSDNDQLPYLNKFEYSPATALDVWQYGPTASSDNSIITRQSTDTWNVMSCVGIGDATVTFTNHTKNSGTSKDVSINVSATQKFHSVSIYSLWGGYPGSDGGTITSAQSAQIMAGTQTSFKISVTPSDAPVIYNAYSEDETLLKIVETGEKLTLDTTGAANITKATVVRIRIVSDWFQDSVSSKNAYYFTFTIIPASVNPAGTTWGMIGYEDHVRMEFTDTSYAGGDSYVGYIHDDGTDDKGTSTSTLSVSFYYTFKNGRLSGGVTAIAFGNNTAGWSTNPTDYILDFYYDAENDSIGVALIEAVGDWEYGMVYSPIFGDCDDDGIIFSYDGFTKL